MAVLPSLRGGAGRGDNGRKYRPLSIRLRSILCPKGEAVGRRNTTLTEIMLQEKRMKELAVYIITTKRFAKDG